MRGDFDNDGGLLNEDCGDENENEDMDMDDVVEEMNVDSPESVDLGPEVREKAISVRERVVNFESTSKTVGLANEIREFCLGKGGECFAGLGLIEPWLADDETASVLLSSLTSGSSLLGQARFCAQSCCPSCWFLRNQPRVC